ncbi:hypothetical protein PG987_013765 [Apiospora arundinis]
MTSDSRHAAHSFRLYLLQHLVKAPERPSLKRQADFDRTDNKRSKIELPIRSASAFNQPIGSCEEPLRAKPRIDDNSDDEDVDKGAGHRGAHNSQLISPPAPTIEAFEPTRRPCLGRSSLDDENFEDPAEELAENPAEKSEVEEDTKDAADKDPAIPISPTPATAGARSYRPARAMGVLILLTQQTSEGISGGLLASDMGMGKTLQMLAFMVIHEHLATGVLDRTCIAGCSALVKRTNGAKNRSDNTPLADDRLCHATSLIIGLPKSRNSNIGPASPANDFEFRVNHDNWSGQAKNPANQRFFYEEEDLEGIDGNEKGLLSDIEGRGRFPENLPAGLIVMNKAHRYLGSGNPTAPFTFLENMRKKYDGPAFLFLVSGSLQATGSGTWFRAAYYFTATNRDHPPRSPLLRRLHWTEKTKIREQLAPKWKEHSTLQDKVVKQIIVCLDQKIADHTGNPIMTFTAPDVAHTVTLMAT